MRFSRSALLTGTFALGATVAAGLALLLVRHFARSVIFPGCPVALPAEPELARLFPGSSLVTYAAPGGPTLVGALVRAQTVPATGATGVIVWFHGNAESAAGNLSLAAQLAASGLGLDVFLAEYRGYGGQGGRPTERNLYADGEAALVALGRLGFAPDRVVLVGRSLGSGVAAELALRRPPALLLLVSPFTSAADMGRSLVGPLAPLVVPDRFDTLSKIGRVKSPVVLLHGTSDEVVPVAMGRRLAAQRPGTRYIEVAGAGHSDFPGLPELVVREVRSSVGP